MADSAGRAANQFELVMSMAAADKLDPGKHVRSERFGFGKVEYDKGATVIVRFDHGIDRGQVRDLHQWGQQGG
jgi:hypothetical protein